MALLWTVASAVAIFVHALTKTSSPDLFQPHTERMRLMPPFTATYRSRTGCEFAFETRIRTAHPDASPDEVPPIQPRYPRPHPVQTPDHSDPTNTLSPAVSRYVPCFTLIHRMSRTRMEWMP
jgi:hypothetical protein